MFSGCPDPVFHHCCGVKRGYDCKCLSHHAGAGSPQWLDVSQAYNVTIQAAREQDALGWHIEPAITFRKEQPP